MTFETPPSSNSNIDPDDFNQSNDDDNNENEEFVFMEEVVESESMMVNLDSDSSDDEFSCPQIFSKLTLTHKEAVFSAKFSPNNELIVTASQEDKACVWDSNSGELVFECEGHEESVIEAQFNNSGTYVATGDMNGSVKVWKVETKSLHDENVNTGEEITWLFWHPVGNVLFAGFKSGDSYMWRLPMTEFKVLYGRGSENICGALLSDGKRLAVGYSDGTVSVFDLKSAREICQYTSRQNTVAVTCMDCYSDNNLIAIGYENEGITIFKTTNKTEIATLKKEDISQQYIESVKFGIGPTSNILAAACGDEIHFWDFSRQSLRKAVKLNGEHPARIQWSTNGLLYVAGVHKNNIYAIDGRSGEVITIFREHQEAILDICLSSDNKLLMSASDDGTVKIYDLLNSDVNTQNTDSIG